MDKRWLQFVSLERTVTSLYNVDMSMKYSNISFFKKNVYFFLILRLFLDVEIIVFFFFFIKLSFTCSKKDKEQSEESYMEYKIFIHFVFPLPDSKITSLSMIHRAAKYNWSLRKRPAREWSFMVTSRACSNTRSGM